GRERRQIGHEPAIEAGVVRSVERYVGFVDEGYGAEIRAAGEAIGATAGGPDSPCAGVGSAAARSPRTACAARSSRSPRAAVSRRARARIFAAAEQERTAQAQ